MRFFALSAAIVAIVAPVLAAPAPIAPQNAQVARADVKSEITTLINDAQSAGIINSTEVSELEQIVNLVNPQDMQMLLSAMQTDLQGFLGMLASQSTKRDDTRSTIDTLISDALSAGIINQDQASIMEQVVNTTSVDQLPALLAEAAADIKSLLPSNTKRDTASDIDSLIQEAQAAGILSQQAASVLEGLVAAGEAAVPELEALYNQLKGQLQAAGISKRDNWVTKIETVAAQAVSAGVISQTTADGIDGAAIVAENDTAKLEQIYNEVVGYLEAAGITPSAKRTDWVSMVEDVTAQALAAGVVNQAEASFIDGVATAASSDAPKLEALYNQVVSELQAAGIVPSKRDTSAAQTVETLITDAVNAGILTQQDATVLDGLITFFSSGQLENLISQLKSQLGQQKRSIPMPTLGPMPPLPSNLPPFPTMGPAPTLPKNKRIMPLEPAPPSSDPKFGPGPVAVPDVEARHIPFPTLGPTPTLGPVPTGSVTLGPTPTLGPFPGHPSPNGTVSLGPIPTLGPFPGHPSPNGTISLGPIPTLGPRPVLPQRRAVDLD